MIKTHFKKSIFYCLLLVLLYSCSTPPNETSPFHEIDRYEPFLKQYLVENNFCTTKDSIHIGLERFAKQLDKNQSFEGIEWISVSDEICKKFREDSIYATIWKVDSQMMSLGSLLDEGEESKGKPFLNITTTLDTTHIYFQTLKNNFGSLQGRLQDIVMMHLDRIDVPGYRIMINLEKRADIDYQDPMLKRMIIVEFIFDYLNHSCNRN